MINHLHLIRLYLHFLKKTDGKRCLYSALLGLQKLHRAKSDFGNELICLGCHDVSSHVEFLPQH